MFLIAGLGNPGLEYANTRHNLGFKVIDEIASRLNVATFKSKFNSLFAEPTLDSHKVIIAKPQTFMNESGIAVRGMLAWYKIDPKKLIVIYDDVDLEVGQIRIREKGSAGGHHGVESVISSVNNDFMRIRVGIGRPAPSGDVSAFVLGKIPPSDADKINDAILVAADAIEVIVKQSLAVAMNKFNA
ncbi:MAG: aminoacyl-tRNA hydrolase [Candidatus Margulisiibacteriota bacterium]